MDNGASSYRRYLDGDDTGFIEIVRDYKDGLTLYINAYVKNIFLAEELMQQTLYILATKRPRFSGKSTFKTWLFAIGRNTAVDYIRHNPKTVELSEEKYRSCLCEQSNVEREYLVKEQKIFLHFVMKRLKEEYYQVLYLTYFESFSNSETAVIMKKSNRQIENLIYRAKIKLRQELEKEGFSYEEL